MEITSFQADKQTDPDRIFVQSGQLWLIICSDWDPGHFGKLECYIIANFPSLKALVLFVYEKAGNASQVILGTFPARFLRQMGSLACAAGLSCSHQLGIM